MTRLRVERSPHHGRVSELSPWRENLHRDVKLHRVVAVSVYGDGLQFSVEVVDARFRVKSSFAYDVLVIRCEEFARARRGRMDV